MAAILNSVDDRRREMSDNVDNVISKSDLVENVGVEVEIASISQAVRKLLPLPFLRPPSWIFGFLLHAAAMAVAPLDSSTSKIGGSRWNFDPMCHRTRDMPGVTSDPPPSVLRVSEIGSGLRGLIDIFARRELK